MAHLAPRLSRGIIPLIRIYTVVALLVVGAFTGVLPAAPARADASPVIVVGSTTPQLEQYAATGSQNMALPRCLQDATDGRRVAAPGR